MKKLLLALALAGLSAAAQAADNPAGQIQKADRLYAERTGVADVDQALRLYQAAVTTDTPTNVAAEAQWKVARLLHWLGDHGPKKEKSANFERGIEHAKKAIELDPKSAPAHFWLGANWGSYGETRGVMKSLSLIKPIRAEMETVLALDEKYQGGGGYRVLGIVDYKVPGFAGGNKKRARERLEKAVAIDPKNAFNRYYLAEYFEVMGEDEMAREQLDALDAATTTAEVDGPDLKALQEKGAVLRKRLRKPKG